MTLYTLYNDIPCTQPTGEEQVWPKGYVNQVSTLFTAVGLGSVFCGKT